MNNDTYRLGVAVSTETSNNVIRQSQSQLADTFRRFASLLSPSGLSTPDPFFSSARASAGAEVCASDVVAVLTGFFLTRTPLSDFFASFLTGAGAGFALGGPLLLAALVTPIGGGLFAAVSRAATALCAI